ncbi:MAG: hypothetical protein ACRC68_03185 [Clostridium sp.]
MNNYNCENSSVVVGNSVDIDMKNKQLCASSEIRSDIMVEEFNAKRIWGQIINCNNKPVANGLVKLVKISCENGQKYYQGIAHTITNCEGFYQFDICGDNTSCYKIIVNKSTTGAEAIIDNKHGNCNTCAPNNNCGSNGQSYNPCNTCNDEFIISNMDCSCNETQNCNCYPNMNKSSICR